MTTVIVDYNSGNLHSAQKSFERMAGDMAGDLGTERILVTNRYDDIFNASRIVLPGVGAFAHCKKELLAQNKLFSLLKKRVKEGVPFLGICVGMQMMADVGREDGDTPGFKWIKGEVIALPSDSGLKVPQMGWNNLIFNQKFKTHPVLEGLDDDNDNNNHNNHDNHGYFVHSYHMRVDNPDHSLATVDYGVKINAIVGRDNIIGTQFHPEKSQDFGLRLISNFLRWSP